MLFRNTAAPLAHGNPEGGAETPHGKCANQSQGDNYN